MDREYSDSDIILGKLDVSIDKSDEINHSLNQFLDLRFVVKSVKPNEIYIVHINKNINKDTITNGEYVLYIEPDYIKISKVEGDASLSKPRYVDEPLHKILSSLGILNNIEAYRYNENENCFTFAPFLFDKKYFFSELIIFLKNLGFGQFSLSELTNLLKKLSSSNNKNIRFCVVMYDRITLKTKRVCKEIDSLMLEYAKFDIESVITEDLITKLFDNVITFRIFQVNDQGVYFYNV